MLLDAAQPYRIDYCDPTNTTDIPLHVNNAIYTPNGTANYQCGNSALTLAQWQALGLDAGTIEGKTPDVSQVIQWARDILFLKSGYGVEEEKTGREGKAALYES